MVLYYLYVLHQELQNKTQSNSYKQQLLSEFPKSEYAQIINDPSFFETATSQQSEVEELYQSAYELYENGNTVNRFMLVKTPQKKHRNKFFEATLSFFLWQCVMVLLMEKNSSL